ncbi:hypothetical protein QBA36_40010 [Streptomyces stelliscabiei]
MTCRTSPAASSNSSGPPRSWRHGGQGSSRAPTRCDNLDGRRDERITGITEEPAKGTGGPNKPLAAALKEAGCSYASLALRVNDLGRCQGADTNYDKASVTRWLQGQQPRGNTPELIAAVLGERWAARSLRPTSVSRSTAGDR